MSELQGNALAGPNVEPVGYKHIVRTLPLTGEVIDADLYLYCVKDTKSDSVRGREIRYYEGQIIERVSEMSVDAARPLITSTFELSEDVVDKTNAIYDAIVQGAVVDLDAGDTVITGPDLQYYYELLHVLSEDAVDPIKSLVKAGVFIFEDDAYNDNVYDAVELDLKIEAAKTRMKDETHNIESTVVSYDTGEVISS